MRKTLREIAEIIGGEVVGDGDTVITGVCGIKEAAGGDIAFLANPKYQPLLESTKAAAVITSRDVSAARLPIIRTENPSLAFAKVVALAMPEHNRHPRGIHPTAVIGRNVVLGKDTGIGAYAVIDEGACVGDRTVIYPGSYIGHHSKIGSDTLIYANVSVREEVTIGDRVIIHSGAVVGSDGFGFVTIDGVHHKIPQVGTVVVEDDVEIGANVTIDRARFDKTVIGKGTKIDNLVQIAHNVAIGQNGIIVAQVGIAGSAVVGNNVTIAGQVGIVGHITVGDRAIVAAQSGVNKSVPAGTMVWGYPAKPMATALRVNACVQNLPKLVKTIEELKRKVAELEAKLKEK